MEGPARRVQILPVAFAHLGACEDLHELISLIRLHDTDLY